MHEDILELIERSNVAFPKVGGGVSQAAISAAEATLNIRLPDSFKWWLSVYGGGQIKGDIVYGLDEEGNGRADIVELAKTNESYGLYERNHLVFYIGNGENFLFDTTKMENGEYQVLLHDISQDELITYAQSFAEFLRRRIRELYRIA